MKTLRSAPLRFTWALVIPALLIPVLQVPVAAAADHHGPDHASTHHASADHSDAGAHGHGHVPHFSDINWFVGLLGEKEGVEPSLWWRPPGTPIPLGALLLNTAILFYLIGRFGGPGIRQGLLDRKDRIAGDIQKAAAMRKEAEGQLAHYEDKLAEMEAEMARIRQEMQQQAEADRERILKETKERRAAMEAEAKQMIHQELAGVRHQAMLRAVSQAVEAARDEIRRNITAQDHQRLTQEFLADLEGEAAKRTEARS
jgi:F-type H+-transporting ATPase subunit b